MGMEYIPAFFGYRKSFASLSDEEFGRVIRAALGYAEEGIIPELSPLESLAFAVMRGDIDRAKDKYEAIAERNRTNGMKGGRPKNPENPVGYLGTQENPENPEEPKKPIQDKTKQNKTKQDNINVGVDTSAPTTPATKKDSKKKEFIPPTAEEVRAYCEENELDTIDPEWFVEYYGERKWIKENGKPVENWKLTVREWANRDKRNGYTGKPKAAAKKPSRPAGSSFDTDEMFDAALMRTDAQYEEMKKEGFKSPWD